MRRKTAPQADVGVIVGRFQLHCLHHQHRELIQTVCSEHPKVIVLLGLSPCIGTRNNPLDFESRKQMILQSFPDVNVLYIKDVQDDVLWSKKLDSQISDLIGPNQTAILYGGRDSFIEHYTGKFPCQELEPSSYISGTEIRKQIGNKTKASEDFRAGAIWSVFNQYSKCFPTVDIAVMNEDNSAVLLCRKPDEKLYRFIGGFAQPNSPSFEADARREVMEEANIEISDPIYLGSKTIDDWRYKNEVDKIKTLFFVATYIHGRPEAADDVAEVKWVSLDTLTASIVPEHLGLLDMLSTYISNKKEQQNERKFHS